MTKEQVFILGLFVLLFIGLYFGCDTKSNDQKNLEVSRELVFEQTNISVLLNDAKSAAGADMLHEIESLEYKMESAVSDSVRVSLLKELSGAWYDLGRADIAGYYAEEIGKMSGDEESWSIAGTTYSLCFQRTKEEKVRSYCVSRAISAFENAISLNPSNVNHRLNLALCYIESPPDENPMQGILMLVELNKKHPENVPVLVNLGRLALQTGQLEKALQRLENAEEYEPENRVVVCLLAKVYTELGEFEKAKEYVTRCNVQSGD